MSGNNNDLSSYAIASRLAEKAHEGQTRRYTGRPYITHPLRVASLVYRQTGDRELMAAAVAHDSVEDGGISYADLEAAGLPERVVYLVDVLTKRDAEEYFDDYLARIKPNKDATTIKIADILDNLADHPSKKQVQKYAEALKFLLF